MRITIQILTLCGLMLESSFTARKNTDGMALGDTLPLVFLFDYMDIDSRVSITWRLSYSYMYLSSHVRWSADYMVRASLSD